MTAYTFSKNLSNAASDTENNFNYYNLKATYPPRSIQLGVKVTF